MYRPNLTENRAGAAVASISALPARNETTMSAGHSFQPLLAPQHHQLAPCNHPSMSTTHQQQEQQQQHLVNFQRPITGVSTDNGRQSLFQSLYMPPPQPTRSPVDPQQQHLQQQHHLVAHLESANPDESLMRVQHISQFNAPSSRAIMPPVSTQANSGYSGKTFTKFIDWQHYQQRQEARKQSALARQKDEQQQQQSSGTLTESGGVKQPLGRPRRKSIVTKHAAMRKDEDASLDFLPAMLSAGRTSHADKSSEIFCPVCDKKYKNQICLQKHAWEHHRSWDYAKKLMLTKHQSVQIMEAAQALLNLVTATTMKLTRSGKHSTKQRQQSRETTSAASAASACVTASSAYIPTLQTPRLAGTAYNSDDDDDEHQVNHRMKLRGRGDSVDDDEATLLMEDGESMSSSSGSSRSGSTSGCTGDIMAGSPCYSDSVDIEA